MDRRGMQGVSCEVFLTMRVEKLTRRITVYADIGRQPYNITAPEECRQTHQRPVTASYA